MLVTFLSHFENHYTESMLEIKIQHRDKISKFVMIEQVHFILDKENLYFNRRHYTLIKKN